MSLDRLAHCFCPALLLGGRSRTSHLDHGKSASPSPSISRIRNRELGGQQAPMPGQCPRHSCSPLTAATLPLGHNEVACHGTRWPGPCAAVHAKYTGCPVRNIEVEVKPRFTLSNQASCQTHFRYQTQHMHVCEHIHTREPFTKCLPSPSPQPS